MKLKFFILLVLAGLFFSFRIESVPDGITLDEAAFGYNANLLSQTYRDENSRFMPMFVLSINGSDWRQPVPQYLMVGFFKIFGPSVKVLKLTSAFTAAVSAALAFIIGGLPAFLFFLITPLVLIQSHLGLDNLTPLPFVFLWLIFLSLFSKSKKLRYLVFSALALGVAFYSYKAMRSFVPIWTILTCLYLILSFRARSRNLLITFIASILPFYLIIPLLEYKYAGAVFGTNPAHFDSVYKFFHSYLASFDPAFLFITGDEILHHSTSRHGLFLLASLPFFIVGLWQAIKKDRFWQLVVAAFFFGPLLFGFPGSYHRASRLTGLIPPFVLLAGLGATYLSKLPKLKILFFGFTLLALVNAFDFLNYYWKSYAADTRHIFYHTERIGAYRLLKDEAQSRGLIPYLTSGFVSSDDEKVIDNFFRSISFLDPLPVLADIKDIPADILLMSRSSDLKLNRLDISFPDYYFYTE